MIVSYKTGAEFLQDNQTYLQKNPYLSTFFTLDAPLLQEAGKINYALRCEQGETRLLALKVEPYNLLLFGEEACVPELLRFLFDGGYEIKNYLCASELGYVLMREMQPYGRCYEEALAMDFMEARRVTEPSAPEVEPAREDDLDEIFDCAQRFVADCGLLDKPEKESFRKVLDSIRVIRADGKILGAPLQRRLEHQLLVQGLDGGHVDDPGGDAGLLQRLAGLESGDLGGGDGDGLLGAECLLDPAARAYDAGVDGALEEFGGQVGRRVGVLSVVVADVEAGHVHAQAEQLEDPG